MKYLTIFFLVIGITIAAQKKSAKPTLKKIVAAKSPTVKINEDLIKINDQIPALIPQKMNGKFGYINQKGKVIIRHEYSNVGFFTEDCNLLNSPNAKAKKYGSDQYASVHLNGLDFRIDQAGKRVYLYKATDLGKCTPEFKSQLFHGYIMNDAFGIIEDSKFENPGDYRHFKIYPQYSYLHIMEGDDLENPMIIAAKNDWFGVIDVNNKIIIPFEYSDIKRNFSWKLAKLFEVTKDGVNYYYVDASNKAY